MSVYSSLRRRVLRRAVEPVALAFEALANEMHNGLPPHHLMTRDDVVKLLRDVARTIRTGIVP